MGEHLLINPEHQPEHREQRKELKAESPELKAEVEQKTENGEQKTGDRERNQDKSIDVIRQKISETAAKAAETKVDKGAAADDKQPLYVNRELKAESFRRTLNRTRKHLSKPQRALSKAVHQPVVDALSKVGEKTIARPTGLLTGSIIALAGSSYLLYSAKHYGYQYNYLTVILLFAAGYALGLVIELLAHALHHRSKH